MRVYHMRYYKPTIRATTNVTIRVDMQGFYSDLVLQAFLYGSAGQ